VDAAHIVRDAIGEHVKKIQTALALLLRDPPCGIADGEARAGRTTHGICGPDVRMFSRLSMTISL
jgi:hypothetical protein